MTMMNERYEAELKRQRKAERWCRDRERSEEGRRESVLAVTYRTREAERQPYLLVVGHRVKGLLVRKADLAVGIGPALFPHTEASGVIVFRDGFKLWPSGEIIGREPGTSAGTIRLTDWTECALYDVVEIGGGHLG